MRPIVELRGARIPYIGWIAHHYWLVARPGARAEEAERWEVWQQPGLCTRSRGHLHVNLRGPAAGVGWGGSWVEHRFHSDHSRVLIDRLRQSFGDYPWCDRYRYWPGPNSNTYVQWVLGSIHKLPWQAIGRAYGCRAAGLRLDAGQKGRLPSEADIRQRSRRH